MAMTSEERSDYPLCGAKKKNGEKCRAFAGQGTKHPGVGACRHHFGNSPAHEKHAAKREVERKMMTMGAPMNITPAAALMGVLRATAGHVSWLATEVANLSSLDGPDAANLTTLYAEERDRLARVGAACLSAGIGKAEVELAEAQTEAVAKAINAAMSRVGGLSSKQKQQFGQALRQELAGLSAPNPALPAPDAGSVEPVPA